MEQLTTNAARPGIPKPSYWEGRSELFYYRCVEMFVAGFAPKGRSIIDVGSNQSPLLEGFDWFRRRVSLDLRRPYRSEKVRGVKKDFLTFEPKRPFSLALCLQVLEHVQDPQVFAQKLFTIASDVIISVPYLWPEKSSRHHIHDMIDEKTLEQWTGRPASHSFVATELFSTSTKARRMIAFYQNPSKPFSLKAANRAFMASKFSRAATTENATPSSPAPEL